MTKGLLFWIIYVICILSWAWGRPWGSPFPTWGWGLVVFVLLFILGWHNFGFIVR